MQNALNSVTEWWDTGQTASFLKISKSKLDHARASGELRIPFVKIGRRILYSPKTVVQWLEKHETFKTVR